MADSGHNRARLAQALGVARRTLDKWLLPEASKDFRKMPETAIRLLANQYGIRRSSDFSMPYDWTDPAIPNQGLILKVLRRAEFADLVKLCMNYGIESVRAAVPIVLDSVDPTERGLLARILSRMIGNIETALATTQQASIR
ncbi:MAG: hypothetical protein RL322_1070 [Pseudomonadota bacterium]